MNKYINVCIIVVFLFFLEQCAKTEKNHQNKQYNNTPTQKASKESYQHRIDGTSVPFIKRLILSRESNDIDHIKIRIEKKPDSWTDSLEYKISKNYINNHKNANKELEIPIIGLYENYNNKVEISLLDQNNNQIYNKIVNINTEEYKGPEIKQKNINDESIEKNGISKQITKELNNPNKLQKKQYIKKNAYINSIQKIGGVKPSFQYFLIKSISNESPVIMDIDGEIRWVSYQKTNKREIYTSRYFSKKLGSFLTINLDGTIREHKRQEEHEGYKLASDHHNVRPSKNEGKYLKTTNNMKNNRIIRYESTVYEVDEVSGEISNSWDIGEILKNKIMEEESLNNKELLNLKKWIKQDIAIINPKINNLKIKNKKQSIRFYDWCHINDIVYNSQDNSITVSSREQFIINIDYDTKAINWILGSPEKHWHLKYPSLQKFALKFKVGEDIKYKGTELEKETFMKERLFPIGQHSINFKGDKLTILNNGSNSNTVNIEIFPNIIKQDESRKRTYGQTYIINKDEKTATLVWQYDTGTFCHATSSIYQDDKEHGDFLVNLATAENKNTHIIRIINENTDTLFELKIPRNTREPSDWLGWNAVPFDEFKDMVLK